VGIGTLLIRHFPFPDDNAVLQLVSAEKPVIFIGIKYAYQARLFSTPFIGWSMLFSLAYIFFVRPREVAALTPLPPYPKVVARERLSLVVGELHHPKRSEPAEEPHWLTIPDRGLYTGMPSSEPSAPARRVAAYIPLQSRSLAIKLEMPIDALLHSYSKSRVTSATRCGRS
jgi:hypothetical protein